MLNFQFFNPTHVVFGKGMIAQLKNLLPANTKILMTYGGGSIKKNGVYEQVKEALKGFEVVEFSGIEPNPEYETCLKAVEIVNTQNIGFILAVGGGSVLDASKFISVAAGYDGDKWEIMQKLLPLPQKVPVGAVMTLPATGSEMNCNLVISRRETKEKFGGGIPSVFPKFSIIDPSVTFSLPMRQTVNGIVDTFVHVMEQYATYDVDSPLQDRWALSIIQTLIEEAPKVLENPNDYNVRANLFWCATTGLNFMIAPGVVQDWATHALGHELTALYGLDHGQSLAVILPRLWKALFNEKKQKLAKMARIVWNVTGTDDEAAEKCIALSEDFFRSIGMKTKLSEYNVNALEAAEMLKQRFAERGVNPGETGKLTPETIYKIVSES